MKSEHDKLSKEQEIIKILFKEPYENYNSRSMSKKIGMSHAGAFKILKKLEQRQIANPKKIGRATIYSLNPENPLALREIEMALTQEAQNHRRWIEEFKEFEKEAKVGILFGSVLRNENQAKDIDLLIISEKDKFVGIKNLIIGKNKVLNKKIHQLIQTEEDFKKDFKDKNKVTLEILKTGIVLFGQENLSKIVLKMK